MPNKYLFINSTTTGKFTTKTINARKHIVVKIKPIRGDIAMNRLFYPDAEITNSFQQLDMLLAPSPHPLVNGVKVSAFHPLAINANNVGGIVRNPRKQGKDVFAEIALDVEVANSTDDGKEIIRRIKAGEKIGVSTGLIPEFIENRSGVDDFGKPFDAVVHNIKFDHVAILLNETPAGDHAGTEMIVNVSGKEYIASFSDLVDNELSSADIRDGLTQALIDKGIKDAWVHGEGIFPESKTFVYSLGFDRDSKSFKQSYTVDSDDKIMLLGEPIEVERKVEFIEVKPPEIEQMPASTTTNTNEQQLDKQKVVLAIIGNSQTIYDDTAHAKLMAMDERGLINAVCIAPTVDEAKKLLANDGFDFKIYDEFLQNKDQFKLYLTEQSKKTDEVKKEIVANSDFTLDMLANKPFGELKIIEKLSGKTKPETQGYQVLPLPSTINNSSDGKTPKINYEFNYAMGT